jgi:nitroreductase
MKNSVAFRNLVRRTRRVRRFHEDRAVDRQTLVELIDLARLSASGGNKQPLKYILSCAASMNARIFAFTLRIHPQPSQLNWSRGALA